MKRAQLMALLEMQGAMNAKVNPNWLKAEYPFLRAVVVEGAEAMEHYGWKWWKKQDADIEQFKIELVDIFHFALSDMLVKHNGDVMRSAIAIEDSMGMDSVVDVVRGLERMISNATSRAFSFSLLAGIMREVSMSWDDMYVGYVAKNVLNFFRQDHGYKTGTYIKSWMTGIEDNAVLAGIVNRLDPSAPDFAEVLYDELSLAYVDVLQNHGRLAEAAAIMNAPKR